MEKMLKGDGYEEFLNRLYH